MTLNESAAYRIAYITEIFPSKSETWIQNEIIRLIELGHDIKVYSICPKPQDIPQEYKKLCDLTTYIKTYTSESLLNILFVPLYLLKRKIAKPFLYNCKGVKNKCKFIRDLFYAIEIKTSIMSFNPNFTYAHFIASRASIAYFLKVFQNIPYIVKIHAGDIFNEQPLLREKISESLVVFSISEYNIRYLKRTNPNLNFDKIKINRCGIPAIKITKNVCRMNKSSIKIVTVGRLIRMKGFDTLIKSIPKLTDKLNHIELAIVGYGPEKQNLTRLCTELNVSKYVKFYDYCSPLEVSNILKNSSLFVLPSKYDDKMKTQDGIPVALMEAMAIGLPVISTKISGIPELIEDGKEGLLVEPNSPELLAEAIIKMINMNENDLQIIKEKARNKIINFYNSDVLVSDLISEVNTII